MSIIEDDSFVIIKIHVLCKFYNIIDQGTEAVNR